MVISCFLTRWGWSGGAMVLGKLPVPGRPANLDHSRARAYLACSRCGLRIVWTFFLCLSLLSSFSLSLGAGGGQVVRWCWVNFQWRGILQFDYGRAGAYCACSRCGWGWFGHFYSHLSFLLFLPLFGRRPDID